MFTRDASGFTPLHTLAAACASSHHTTTSSDWIEFASVMVEKNKRILFEVASNGSTPLHVFVKTATTSKHLKFLKWLLVRSNISSCDNTGRSVIHDAARRGVTNVMSAILDHDNGKSDLLYKKSKREKWNVLHFSVRYGKHDMAKFLTLYDIEAEFLVKARDRSGRTPIFLARTDRMRTALEKNLWTLALHGNVEDFSNTLKMFEFRGSHVEKESSSSSSSKLACVGPMSRTIRRNRVVAHLVALGKSKYMRKKFIMLREFEESCIVSKDNDGRTPLMFVARYGNLDAAKCFIRDEYDLNTCDSSGNTALHYASAYGHMHIVKLLKQSGADSTVKNQDGDTPADVAGGEGALVPDGSTWRRRLGHGRRHRTSNNKAKDIDEKVTVKDGDDSDSGGSYDDAFEDED